MLVVMKLIFTPPVMWKKNASLLLFIFCIASNVLAQNKVSGRITDAITGERLFGVAVYDLNSQTGDVSDRYGDFVFSTDQTKVHLKLSFFGYQSQEFILTLSGKADLAIQMKPYIELQTVEITASKLIKPEGLKLDKKFINSMPAFLGENDVLKAAHFLPGVQRTGEGTAGMVVRGGSPDQNLILLDGVPVYNAYHALGFMSVFNPLAIQNAYLMKGAFPARYNGRLSSVMDIQTKEGRKDKVTGSVGLGPVVSHFHLEGPLDSLAKSSFVVSARRTFLDVFIGPIVYLGSGGDFSIGLKFQDFNLKWNRKLGEKDHLYVSTYFGKDKMGVQEKGGDVESEFGLAWGNELALLRWTHRSSSGIFMDSKAYYSRYNFSFELGTSAADNKMNFDYASGIQDFGSGIHWKTGLGNSTLRWGMDVVAHSFSPGITQISFDTGDSLKQNVAAGRKVKSIEGSGFLEWEKRWTSRMKTNAGVNANALWVEETQYHFFDPRLKMTYQAGNHGIVSFGFSQMTQYVHLLTNPGFAMPTDLWLFSTKNIKPGRSRELSLSYGENYSSWNWEVSAYHRFLTNMIEIKEGKDVLSSAQDWENNVSSGIGEAYGVELSVNKNWDRFEMGSSIALSRSWRKVDGISGGKWFPYKYDRPLYFSSFGSYKLSKTKSLSFAFNLSSGNRFTMEEGRIQAMIENVYYQKPLRIYGPRNGQQFPLYHRLDLAYETRKTKTKGERILKFSVLNVYNKLNPAGLDPTSNFSGSVNTVAVKSYSIIPFFPSFKWIRTF